MTSSSLGFAVVGSALLAVGCAHSSVGTSRGTSIDVASIGAPVTVAGSIQPSQAVLDERVLSDFHHRIDRYMKLHDNLDRRGTPQSESANVGENMASRQLLATRIRSARRDAKQGDILGPPIAAALRRAMNPELRGDSAARTRSSIRENAPVTFVLEVNGAYPEGAPRSTMPGNVLNILPLLPDDLEYRIVDTHLVLMDRDANIVVDYLLDVMCANC